MKFSADKLDLLLLTTRPVVENLHPTGTDEADPARWR